MLWVGCMLSALIAAADWNRSAERLVWRARQATGPANMHEDDRNVIQGYLWLIFIFVMFGLACIFVIWAGIRCLGPEISP